MVKTRYVWTPSICLRLHLRVKVTHLDCKKLTLTFSAYISLPPIHPTILHPPNTIHMVNETRPSFFAALLFPCVIVNANGRSKWGRPGNKARAGKMLLCFCLKGSFHSYLHPLHVYGLAFSQSLYL